MTKELVSTEAFKNLEVYVDMIEEKNKVMNLTGFKEDRLWQEGIYESIFVLLEGFGEANKLSILDIGAGAGFPSVPYLIAFPDNKLTIYEPQGKRSVFLESVKKELGLNMVIKNSRIEESDEVEVYDLLTARAVASFKVLAEISHKIAKVGATFAFFKGPKAKQEIDDAGKIMHKLVIQPEIRSINTPDRDNNLIVYTKFKETPEDVPRRWAEIVKK